MPNWAVWKLFASEPIQEVDIPASHASIRGGSSYVNTTTIPAPDPNGREESIWMFSNGRWRNVTGLVRAWHTRHGQQNPNRVSDVAPPASGGVVFWNTFGHCSPFSPCPEIDVNPTVPVEIYLSRDRNERRLVFRGFSGGIEPFSDALGDQATMNLYSTLGKYNDLSAGVYVRLGSGFFSRRNQPLRADEVFEQVMQDVGAARGEYAADVSDVLINPQQMNIAQPLGGGFEPEDLATSLKDLCDVEFGRVYDDRFGIVRFETAWGTGWSKHRGVLSIPVNLDAQVEFLPQRNLVVNRISGTTGGYIIDSEEPMKEFDEIILPLRTLIPPDRDDLDTVITLHLPENTADQRKWTGIQSIRQPVLGADYSYTLRSSRPRVEFDPGGKEIRIKVPNPTDRNHTFTLRNLNIQPFVKSFGNLVSFQHAKSVGAFGLREAVLKWQVYRDLPKAKFRARRILREYAGWDGNNDRPRAKRAIRLTIPDWRGDPVDISMLCHYSFAFRNGQGGVTGKTWWVRGVEYNAGTKPTTELTLTMVEADIHVAYSARPPTARETELPPS